MSKKTKKAKTNIKLKMKPTALTANITPWGSYEYIYVDLPAGIVVKKLTIKEGHRFSLQSHSNRFEYWRITVPPLNNLNRLNCFSIIIEDIYICEKNYNLYTLIKVPSGLAHRAEALVGDLEIIETSTFDNNKYSTLEEFESDIIRYHDDYGRT